MGDKIGVLEQRPAGPDRHAARDLQQSEEHLRRALRRLAADEPASTASWSAGRAVMAPLNFELPFDGAGNGGTATAGR